MIDVYKNVKEWNVPSQIYDKWITSDHINGQYRDQSHYHPSDLGYCTRKAILERIHYPGHRYTIPRIQRIFAHGHSTHERYQEHFGSMGILYGLWICANCDHLIGTENKIGVKYPHDCPNCHNPKMTREVRDHHNNVLAYPKPIFYYKELPVVNEVMDISGHTDGVVEIDGELHVIDWKTCSKFAFEKICGKSDSDWSSGFKGSVAKPMEAHVFQINIYMFILGIKRGILFYENRDKMDTKTFLLELDNDIIQEVIRRIMAGNKALENNSVPEIPEKLKDPNGEEFIYCKGFPGLPPCPFFYFCHPQEWLNKGGYDQYKKFIKIEARVDFDT